MPSYLTYPKPLTLQTLDSHMVHIEGGIYLRGDEHDGPVHQVKLDAFELCRFPVSQILWKEVMRENPSEIKSANRSVENISWEECKLFLKSLNKLNKGIDRLFRLPTEAEWEFAARGWQDRTSYYSGSPNLKEVGFFQNPKNAMDGNSQQISHPIGLRMPNEFGLYDMSGNVWEWCEDGYNGYDKWISQFQRIENPIGSAETSLRVRRGGGWYSEPVRCQLTYRNSVHMKDKFQFLSLRLARS